MVSKEDVGKVLKKAARVIPGIGSYQDKEASRQSDKALRMRLSARLDETLGLVEWLKTDQLKKGAMKHMKDLDDLSRHIEKVSRMMVYSPRGYAGLFADQEVDLDRLNELFEYDKGLWDLLSQVELGVNEISAERAVVQSEDVEGIRKKLFLMENRIEARESLLKGSAE